MIDQRVLDTEFLRPLVNGWIGKMETSEQSRAPWKEVADECLMFYSKSAAAMWDPSYQRKFWRNVKPPRFRITINKAFEFVAIYAPNLLWDTPHRTVEPKKPLELPPEIFPDEQTFQMMQQMYSQERAKDKALAVLLETWLNYTTKELPGGGLRNHSLSAVVDALIQGRGCLWCLGATTQVYVKLASGVTSMALRDLAKTRCDQGVQLWNGSRWTRLLGMSKSNRSDGISIVLRSGEQIDCTPEHKWPTLRGLLETKDLVVGDRLTRTILPEPDSPLQPSMIPDDIGWFVGLYIAEGSYGNQCIHISGHAKEHVRRDRLREIVSRYGGSMRVYCPSENECEVVIASRVLRAILDDYVEGYGARKKHLHSRCWNRSNAFLRNVLDGYLDGDGHYEPKAKRWKLGFCNNRYLARDIRIICARLGLRLTLKKCYSRDGSILRHGGYRGSIAMSSDAHSSSRDRNEIVAISDARSVAYWDLGVEDEPHVFALSSGVLTHNSKPYQQPSSGRLLTGCFHDSPRNLFLDPDFNDMQKCKWIARRCVEPTWAVERRYGLPTGSLSHKATLESAWGYGESKGSESANMHRVSGSTNDLIVYYEVYSKTGVGVRRTDVPSAIRDHLERIVGDYAYIVVSPSVPYPLNMPSENMRKGATEAEVRQAFQWPVPFWADDRWPVTCLDFYPDPSSAWPIPPLAPGLGELKFLNCMIPWLCNRIWTSSRDFWAVLQSYANDLEKYLEEGNDQQVIPIRSDAPDINKILQVIQQPETRLDSWKIVELVSNLFDKRVGLTDIMYGMSDTQDRSAEATKQKSQMLGIRPDYMRSQVKDWQSQAAVSEAYISRLFIRGDSVGELMGQVGAMMWDQIVSSADVEKVLRQFDYSISAASIRRPDRDRDQENAQYLMQQLGPIADNHANISGDTGPLNSIIHRLGQTMDFSLEGIEFGPRAPQPPSPEEQQMAQEQMQLERDKGQMELEKIQANTQATMLKAQVQAEQGQLKLQFERERMAMDQQRHEQEMEQDQEMHDQELETKQQMSLFDMVTSAQTHRQGLMQSEEQNKAKIQSQKAQAKAKSNGKPAKKR